MKHQKSFLIVAFVLITLACNSMFNTSHAVPVKTPFHTPQRFPTITAEAPINTLFPTPAIPTEMAVSTPGIPVLEQGDDQCGGTGWEFKPISIYRYPKGNGTDIVIIDLSIHNPSDRLSTIVYFTAPVVTTDDDKAYRPFDPFYKPLIPNDPL